MINITIKLFAQFRENKFKVESREYIENSTALDIVKNIDLNIEKFPIGVLMVNGKHIKEDYKLKDGDTLAIFPKIGGG